VPSAREYEVKAAYLLNFTRYVAWPNDAFLSPDEPLTICIIGQDPFGSALDRLLDGRRTQGRSLRVRRINKLHEAVAGCQVAYGNEFDPALFNGRAVLTVGDDGGFAARGGVIGFVPVDETVRFEINVDAARANRLQISSRMR
jgi:hypothetical protein